MSSLPMRASSRPRAGVVATSSGGEANDKICWYCAPKVSMTLKRTSRSVIIGTASERRDMSAIGPVSAFRAA